MPPFAGQVVSDWAASFSSALVFIGDELGLYRALNVIQLATPAALAARTGTSERDVRGRSPPTAPDSRRSPLICFFDALHDMGDPLGALRHARAALAPPVP